MARIKIKVDNKELLYFDSYNFSTQIDASAASVSFSSFIDFETFGYSYVQVFRNEVLTFTGEIINKVVPDGLTAKPFIYKCESLTHVLFESTLPTTAYPLQLENSTLKDIVEYICSFFDITVVFDQSAETESKSDYKLSDLGLGKTAGTIINELITQQGLILSHDADGQLIVTKSIDQSEITLPKYTDNSKSYNLKKFFHNYIALGQAPIGADADIQAIAKFTNIPENRSITKIQDSGGIADIENKALGMRADSLKAITQNLTFDNFFCNVGDFIILGDLKLIVNQLNYSYGSKGEKASISVIDSNIYTR